MDRKITLHKLGPGRPRPEPIYQKPSPCSMEARSKISLLETKSPEKPMVCIYVNDELDMTDMTSFDQRNLVDETRSNKARKNPIHFEEFLVDGCKYFYDSMISYLLCTCCLLKMFL